MREGRSREKGFGSRIQKGLAGSRASSFIAFLDWASSFYAASISSGFLVASSRRQLARSSRVALSIEPFAGAARAGQRGWLYPVVSCDASSFSRSGYFNGTNRSIRNYIVRGGVRRATP